MENSITRRIVDTVKAEIQSPNHDDHRKRLWIEVYVANHKDTPRIVAANYADTALAEFDKRWPENQGKETK